MNTNVDASCMEWATSLTRPELVVQLRTIVTDPHRLSIEERAAVITIAADDLESS